MSSDSNREKALKLALASIEKAHGQGSIMRLGEAKAQKIPIIPTGSPRWTWLWELAGMHAVELSRPMDPRRAVRPL